MTAAEGLQRAERALDAASARVRAEVAQRFRGGTLPPPPWPQHPALIEARKRVQTLRDGLRAIARRAPTAKLNPKVATALDAAIAQLGNELDVLAARLDAAQARGEDVIAAAKALPAALAGGAFIWALALWIVLDLDRSG